MSNQLSVSQTLAMAAQHSTTAEFSSRYKFNAKELDQETGWYYYGARYYDPSVSQWLSIDPLLEKYPAFNPYNYTMNNPIMLVDFDGRSVEDVIAKDLKSQENIKNQLREEDRQYITFDKNGKLNTENLNSINSNSENLKNLRVLANAKTVYTFESSSNFKFLNSDTNKVEKLELFAKIGTKGITLFPEKIGKNNELSTDKNVNIFVNNKGSDRETAKTTAHEIVHAVAYELRNLGYNPNHKMGFLDTDDGSFIMGDKNRVLHNEIKRAEKEAYNNFDNQNK